MAEDSQSIRADAIADDDEKLKEKVKLLVRKYSIIPGLRRTHLTQVGHDVTLDSEKVGGNFEAVDSSSVCAILLRKDSAWGAVRVYSNPIKNIVSGPNQGTGFVIIVIGPGQTCRLFGTPSVRYFHRC